SGASFRSHGGRSLSARRLQRTEKGSVALARCPHARRKSYSDNLLLPGWTIARSSDGVRPSPFRDDLETFVGNHQDLVCLRSNPDSDLYLQSEPSWRPHEKALRSFLYQARR